MTRWNPRRQISSLAVLFLLCSLAVPGTAGAQEDRLTPREASAHLGKSATVCGTVESFGASDETLTLHLGASYPDHPFQLRVVNDSGGPGWLYLPPRSAVEDRYICGTGKITRGGRVPMIQMRSVAFTRAYAETHRFDSDDVAEALHASDMDLGGSPSYQVSLLTPWQQLFLTLADRARMRLPTSREHESWPKQVIVMITAVVRDAPMDFADGWSAYLRQGDLEVNPENVVHVESSATASESALSLPVARIGSFPIYSTYFFRSEKEADSYAVGFPVDEVARIEPAELVEVVVIRRDGERPLRLNLGF